MDSKSLIIRAFEARANNKPFFNEALKFLKVAINEVDTPNGDSLEDIKSYYNELSKKVVHLVADDSISQLVKDYGISEKAESHIRCSLSSFLGDKNVKSDLQCILEEHLLLALYGTLNCSQVVLNAIETPSHDNVIDAFLDGIAFESPKMKDAYRSAFKKVFSIEKIGQIRDDEGVSSLIADSIALVNRLYLVSNKQYGFPNNFNTLVNDCLQNACVSFKETKECGEKFVSHSIVNIALLVKGSLTH